MIVASRFGAKWLLTERKKNTKKRKRALIYGAGSAGVQLAGALSHSGEYKIFGFVDEKDGGQSSNKEENSNKGIKFTVRNFLTEITESQSVILKKFQKRFLNRVEYSK